MAKYNRKITNELKNSILQNFTDFQNKYNEKSDYQISLKIAEMYHISNVTVLKIANSAGLKREKFVFKRTSYNEDSFYRLFKKYSYLHGILQKGKTQ